MNPGTERSHVARVTCANCGGGAVSTSMEEDRFPYGVGEDATELAVVVPVHTCSECGAQFTDEEAERLRHDAVCEYLGRLTPGEIRDIRTQYKMCRADFAAATKLGEATLARWESGARLPNAAYDQYLRLLRYPVNMATVSNSRPHPVTKEMPPNVVPFPTPRFRVLHLSAELAEHEKVFQLRRG
jgi:putative zinc finger/helix-turn-helix YgiT family protein